MLVAKIKLDSRSEKKKYIFKESKTFSFRNQVFNVDPEGVYITEIFGFLKVRCLDYSVNNPNPIQYFGDSVKVKMPVNIDVMDGLMKSWIETLRSDLLKYVFYVSIAALAVSAINLIMVFGQNGGF